MAMFNNRKDSFFDVLQEETGRHLSIKEVVTVVLRIMWRMALFHGHHRTGADTDRTLFLCKNFIAP